MLTTHLQNYLAYHNVEEGDVVVINAKHKFDPFYHFAVYVGNGQFIANLEPGIQIIEGRTIWQYFNEYALLSVRKLEDNWSARMLAVERAWELYNSGEYAENYSLIRNNCEHFANYVQYGKRYSKQAMTAGSGAVVVGALMLTHKEPLVNIIGIFALLFGGATIADEITKNDENYGRLALPQYYPQKRLR